jgi:predicted  nucleic acid-binding Zn-ribbon protein
MNRQQKCELLRAAVLSFPITRQSQRELLAFIEWLKSQPERPKGRWEDGICTNCGKDVYEGLDADIWSAYIPPFCPNCGAEMER